MASIVNEVVCSAADELLAHLLAAPGQGRGVYENQLFRGVGDERHELIPSAFRPDVEQYLSEVASLEVGERHGKALEIDTPGLHEQYELQALGHFYRFANRQGLRLPPLPQDMHQALIRRKNDMFPFGDLADVRKPWPPPELWSTMALAQHYGVPTRLLDWSSDPLVAAYFAAASGLSKLSNLVPGQTRLAIWLMYASIFDRTLLLSRDPWLTHRPPQDCPEFDRTIYVVDAPNFGNDNLTAQKGRFTLVIQHDRQKQGLDKSSLAVSVSAMMERARTSETASFFLLGEKTPPQDIKIFVKFTLPIVAAPALMLALHQRGYSAATMFPGFKGCEQALSESVAAFRANLSGQR